MSESQHQQPVTDSSVARVMWVVAVVGPVKSKDVADALTISHKNSQRQLARLHRSGLVERKRLDETGAPFVYRVKEP